jgi:hypothetical protein
MGLKELLTKPSGVKGTARVFVSKAAEDLIVIVAESLKEDPWWLYHTLIPGTDSYATLQVEDVDNFCVYNGATRAIVWTAGDNHAGHVLRIHDGTHVNIGRKAANNATVDVLIRGKKYGGVHQCVGAANDECYKQTELKINSDNLGYLWALPKHIAFEAKRNIQWVGPK